MQMYSLNALFIMRIFCALKLVGCFKVQYLLYLRVFMLENSVDEHERLCAVGQTPA